jgi:hypothetical protein
MKKLIRVLLSLTLVAFAAGSFTACTKTTEVVVVKRPVKKSPPKKKRVPTASEFEVVRAPN